MAMAPLDDGEVERRAPGGVLFVALLAALLLLYRCGRRRLFRAGSAD